MLTARRLGKRYGEKRVLRGIDLTLPLGGFPLRLAQLRARPRMRGHRLAAGPPGPVPLRPVTPIAGLRAMAVRLAALAPHRAQRAPAELDWVFLSPAGDFGSWVPGERTGEYRVGGDVALFDEQGRSALSGADFAVAIVDEIETPKHHREHIGVAY